MSSSRVPHFKLEVPLQSSSVKIVRLIASGIANHSGFSVDEIEDIKMATTETLNFFLNHCTQSALKSFKIDFISNEDHLSMRIFGEATNLQGIWASAQMPTNNAELSSLNILNYLVSSVKFHDHRDGSVVELTKFKET